MQAVAGRAGRAPAVLIIDEAYLRRFGELLIPVHLWRALSRFDAWIEPAIVAEWIRLMQGYARGQGREVSDAKIARAMQWSSPERVVGEARQRAIAVIESGEPLFCVWSGARLTKDRLDIDHCFPWIAWPCDDLWNLLPSSRTVNQHEKRDRLPSASALNSARERIQDWWKAGLFVGCRQPSFRAVLPGGTDKPPRHQPRRRLTGADDVFDAVGFQRLRLKENQQIPEWAGRRT